MLKVRDLNNEEREKLGRALDPVLCRWVPIMANWKFEAALLMTVFSLAQTARKDWVTAQAARWPKDADPTREGGASGGENHG
jgi:hypothetical protein